MSKITRRSYKRKKIIMGAVLFGAIGLVSTGFAAWVLSASASRDESANLKVGAVSDKSMSFTGVKVEGLDTAPGSATLGTMIETSNYSFNPRYDDSTGRVRFGSNEGADVGERLSLTISGTVTEAQNLGSLTIGPKTVPDELATAVTKNYIVLPTCLTSTYTMVENTDYTVNEAAGVTTASFSYDVAFRWGSAFGGVNPADYYDSAAGESVTTAEINTTLTELHNLLDTITVEVTITANPN